MFPVLEDSHLMGCVGLREIKETPKEDWSKKNVSDIAKSCSTDNTIGPDEDAMKALTRMHRTGESRLMVVNQDRLLGLISLRDLMNFFSLKLDLEGDE